jgi:nitroreductase
MRRRSDDQLDVQALFGQLSDSRLDWPGKTVQLERNSWLDYRQRPVSPNVSVAELYHENSKLYPNMLGELVATRVQVNDFRQEFVRRRAAAAAGRSPEPSLHRGCRRLLTAVSQVTGPDLSYALEVRVAADNLLATHEPATDALQIVKRLSTGDLARLRDALRLTAPPDVHSPGPMVFLVGSFARNDILFGPRGYRRTLLEAGLVMARLLAEAERLGLGAVPILEFADREVDAVMEADGIEEGTVACLALSEVADVE